jgi:hypothetical protein
LFSASRPVLKGHGFSRAANARKDVWALEAAEKWGMGREINLRTWQGLKPSLILRRLRHD